MRRKRYKQLIATNLDELYEKITMIEIMYSPEQYDVEITSTVFLSDSKHRIWYITIWEN